MSSSVSMDCDQMIEYLASLSESDREKVIQEIGNKGRERDELVEKGKKILDSSGTKVCYLDPTYDKIFKWLVKQSNDKCNFMRTFFDTTLFLAYKNLFERKVDKFEPQSGKFDAMTEQLNKLPKSLSLFKALLMNVSGELAFTKQEISKTTKKAADEKKDSLETMPDVYLQDFAESIVTEIRDALDNGKDGDTIASELQEKLANFIHNHVDQETDISLKDVTEISNHGPNKMLVDIEFQRSRQAYINARVLQYGAILFLSQNATNLLPTLLVSICRWDSSQVVRDVFHAALGENAKEGPTISQVAINIGKAFDPVGKSKEEVEGERRRIEGIIEEGLRIRFPELVMGVKKFEELWTDEDKLDQMSKDLQKGLNSLSGKLQKLQPPSEAQSKENTEVAQQESQISANMQQGFKKKLEDLKNKLKEMQKSAKLGENFDKFEEELQKLKEKEEGLRTAQNRNKLRTAYELLCFLSLAPLTPDLDGRNSGSENSLQVFNKTIEKAYKMIKIDNSLVKDRPDVNEWYVGIANAQQEAEKLRNANLGNLVGHAFSLVDLGANESYITKWAEETFANPINYGMRRELIKKLKERKVEADKEEQKRTVVNILEEEYKNVDQSSTTPKKTQQSQNAILEDPE